EQNAIDVFAEGGLPERYWDEHRVAGQEVGCVVSLAGVAVATTTAAIDDQRVALAVVAVRGDLNRPLSVSGRSPSGRPDAYHGNAGRGRTDGYLGSRPLEALNVTQWSTFPCLFRL